MQLDIHKLGNLLILELSGSVMEPLLRQQVTEMQMTIAQSKYPVCLIIDTRGVEGRVDEVLSFMYHMRSQLTGYSDLATALYATEPVFVAQRQPIEMVRSNNASWLTIFEDLEEAERYVEHLMQSRQLRSA